MAISNLLNTVEESMDVLEDGVLGVTRRFYKKS
jgi:hypothetical protein